MRAILLILAGLTGCQSLGPPPPALRELLATGESSALRRQGRVRISSTWFSGEFDAIAIEDRGASPRVRMQLLQDLGGKLLDLVAHPTGVTAHWPHTGQRERERSGFIGFVCVTLLENAVPVSWDRIVAGEITGTGFRVELSPVSQDLDLVVHAELDQNGKLLARHFQLGNVGWSEELLPTHRLLSRDFEWIFLEESSERIDPPSARLFDLEPRIP